MKNSSTNALATKIGVAVPRTVLLPSNQPPPDTNDKSFRNLGYPLDWEGIFNYVGWPAFFKPFAGGGWKNVYRLHNREEFFRAYNDTGQLVMMLQEEIKFDMYFRCYSIDQRQRPDHAVRATESLSFALPNGVACAEGNSAKGRGGRSAIESISWLRP
jgi:hypothetical protein